MAHSTCPRHLTKGKTTEHLKPTKINLEKSKQQQKNTDDAMHFISLLSNQ
jgi:hypothetical protein